MKIYQQVITLPPKKRGFHLITNEIVSSLKGLHEIKKDFARFLFSILLHHCVLMKMRIRL